MKVIDNIENTEIKKSEIHGYGLFALKEIKKDTLLCVLSGQILEVGEYIKLMESGEYSSNCFVEKYKIDENYFGAMPLRTKYSCINHSEDANMYSKVNDEKLYVYASKKIMLGEEIVDSYNLTNHIDILGGFKSN
jgi:SET domain-containing protein